MSLLSKKILSTFGLSVVLMAGLNSISFSQTVDARRGGTLIYSQDIEPYDWDLSHDWPVSLLTLGGNVFDRLVRLGSDGQYHPWLAETWQTAPDGKSITFHLRKDVTFHNGEKFNAAAVAANIDKWTADTNSWNPTGIGLTKYEVLDDYTIRLDLKAPNAAALWLISTASWGFLAPDVIKNHSAEVAKNFAVQAGTGPYKVESYTPGQGVTLVRNDEYKWAPADYENKGPAHIDKIVVNFVKDPAVRLGALQSGQADLIANVPPVYLSQLQADERYIVYNKQATGVPYQLLLNVEKEPTNDLRVRKALRASFDIKSALNSIYFGHYPQAWSNLAENTPPVGSYNKSLEGSWNYDPDESNRLLDEAGWKERDAQGYRTKDGKRLEIRWAVRSSTIEDQRDTLGEALQAYARQVGIALERDLYDTGTFSKVTKEGSYNLTDRPWSTPDAYILTNSFFSGTSSETGGNNYSRIKDPHVDELARSLTDSQDNALRARNAQELQKLAIENVWSIPIYPRQINLGAQNKVKGVNFDIAGWLESLQSAWIEK